MSFLPIVCGIAIAFALALLRALALDEVRGRIQRRVEASVEATISSLPPELQEEWAEEWRAELAAMKTMPLSAVAFARGLRQTALQLAGASELAPAQVKPQKGASWSSMARVSRVASWLSEKARLSERFTRPGEERLLFGVSIAVTVALLLQVFRTFGPQIAAALAGALALLLALITAFSRYR